MTLEEMLFTDIGAMYLAAVIGAILVALQVATPASKDK